MTWYVAGQKRSVRSSPGAGVAERRVVVQQRVEPHVEDVARDPTGPARPSVSFAAAERDVLQPALDERAAPRCGACRGMHEVGLLGVELLERLLERRQLEEPVLLLLARRAGSRGSGSVLPGSISFSALKSAQRGQYQPSYMPL